MPDEIPKGHYPYQAPIDAYGNGGFRFAGMSHRGSLFCSPAGMDAWRITSPAEITLETLQPMLDIADRIDVLLVGTGADVAVLDAGIRNAFRERQVILEAVPTRSAVSTYNILLSEQRAIAAALLAVERGR